MDRYGTALRRCTKKGSEAWEDYGGRGIEMKFTQEEFISYILENFPFESYKGLHINRIDPDGHYEPGNIQVVPPSISVCNRRNSTKVEFRGMQVVQAHLWDLLKHFHPTFMLSKPTVIRLSRSGMTPDEILRYRRTARGGRGSTTSSTPDPDIVSRYLGGSSTTATSSSSTADRATPSPRT